MINSVFSWDDDDRCCFAVQETFCVETTEINHYLVHLNFVHQDGMIGLYPTQDFVCQI